MERQTNGKFQVQSVTSTVAMATGVTLLLGTWSAEFYSSLHAQLLYFAPESYAFEARAMGHRLCLYNMTFMDILHTCYILYNFYSYVYNSHTKIYKSHKKFDKI